MDFIVYEAYAKINLILDVARKRPDGYHDLNMIMQALDLSDTIFIKKVNEPGVSIKCNYKWLGMDSRNLIYSAVNYLKEHYNINTGLFIDLTKRIPIASGLGGGSADCAAALLALRKLFDLPITDSELLSIGAKLGADVPYCLVSKTALVSGIGDKIKLLSEHPQVTVILVKPNVRISTGEIFSAFAQNVVTKRPNIDKMIDDINKGEICEIAKGFCNVLESVSGKQYPVITLIKETMIQEGALGALMSGSGPTVFSYFKDKHTAFLAVKKIKQTVLSPKEIFFTKTYNPGDERCKAF